MVEVCKRLPINVMNQIVMMSGLTDALISGVFAVKIFSVNYNLRHISELYTDQPSRIPK